MAVAPGELGGSFPPIFIPNPHNSHAVFLIPILQMNKLGLCMIPRPDKGHITRKGQRHSLRFISAEGQRLLEHIMSPSCFSMSSFTLDQDKSKIFQKSVKAISFFQRSINSSTLKTREAKTTKVPKSSGLSSSLSPTG